MGRRVVAILGTGYPDFSLELAELAGLDVELRSGPGDTRDEVVEVGWDAAVILAGSQPRFDASTLANSTRSASSATASGFAS